MSQTIWCGMQTCITPIKGRKRPKPICYQNSFIDSVLLESNRIRKTVSCPKTKMISSWFVMKFQVLVHGFLSIFCMKHPNGGLLFKVAQYCMGLYFNCLTWYSVASNPDFLKMKVEWDGHGTIWLYFFWKWISAVDLMNWANWIIQDPRCYQCIMYF